MHYQNVKGMTNSARIRAMISAAEFLTITNVAR